MVFDLDGTLVQTERMKAYSYANAVIDLCPFTVSQNEVVEAFKDVVGLPRREVARSLIERFDLEEPARKHLREFGVQAAWQALVQIRLGHYEEMLSDPDLIKEHQWPHNKKVLRTAREAGCKTALATMSRCKHAQRIIKILKLQDDFDFIATWDDVENGKPDPEIYHLVARELDVAEKECLVIEDSPSGVEAALGAGMWCIAVTTPFTRAQIHQQGLLDEYWIVDDAERIATVVQQLIVERRD
jgi:HAD superfamily hydrolase (TIGR01509 family)